MAQQQLSDRNFRIAGEMNQEPSGSRTLASSETGTMAGQFAQTQQLRTIAPNSLQQLRIVAEQLSHSVRGRECENQLRISKQAIENLMNALKSPRSEEQRKQVITILKSNPPIMKSFLRYREAQRPHQRDFLAMNETRNNASSQQPASLESPTSLTEQPVAGPSGIVHITNSPATHANPQVTVNNTEGGTNQSEDVFRSLSPVNRLPHPTGTRPQDVAATSLSAFTGISSDIRAFMVQKMLHAIYPILEWGSLTGKIMDSLNAYAKKVEGRIHTEATSRAEYYHLIAERIYKLEKEIKEKERRKRGTSEREVAEPLRASVLNGLAVAPASLSNTRGAGNATPHRTTNQFIEIQPAVVNKLNTDHTLTGHEDLLSPPEQKKSKLSKRDPDDDLGLECPICLDMPKVGQKIFQCRNGHTLCESCSKMVTTCPTCRQPLEIHGQRARNLVAEKYIAKLFSQ